MNDPIKIIHKFKNNNTKIQYKVYIYIGSLVPENIKKILSDIQFLSLYETFDTLSHDNYLQLEKYYGNYWYEKLFISYHINNQKNVINNTPLKKNTLINKYKEEWYNTHIIKSNEKKILYSFSTIFTIYSNIYNKIKTIKADNINFMTHNKYTSVGGASEIEEYDIEDEDEHDANEHDNDNDIEDIPIEKKDKSIDNELDLYEIAKLYTESKVENISNIKKTSELISQAIEDKFFLKKIDELELKYDQSLDNINYDNNLENVYNKYYIMEQYIFKDDNIKTIKNKICVSIPLSNKFGPVKLLPELQYLWCSYKFNKKYESIMIGQKWIIRNELLKIDIIPNENLKTYEKLKNNLRILKEYFGYKIKREDDESLLLRYYDNYITNNEIFLLDTYNELGINYNPSLDDKKNIYDIYINIYYPLLSYERFDQIIQLLQKKSNKEIDLVENNFFSIKNDLKLETEIENIVESIKLKHEKYDSLFYKNNIIQAIIHVYVDYENKIDKGVTNINLFRIFDNFVLNDTCPFIEFQQDKSNIVYKFDYSIIKHIDKTILTKWFELSVNGILFKIKNIKDNKYYTVSLYDNGRIEYKLTWKENENATIDDVQNTFDAIRYILTKINNENKKINIAIPTDDKFKYAFINCMMSFTIPGDFVINHNDLSEFSRYFYNYVALVIDPKKRLKMSKITDQISKYGTYLRYKRINKYDNRSKIHLKIIYILRNYDILPKELIEEISKLFNITTETAAKEIDFVRDKYSKLIKKRSGRLLKKYKTSVLSKLHGIAIDIQGKDKLNYKIRITGIKSKEQMNEIIQFVKVLIYLYIEIYLHKNKEYEKLKDKLYSLTKIAKRRHKVADLVEYDNKKPELKKITALDKSRLAFRPEKGQSQWTRFCQNNGTEKRRPIIIPQDNVESILKNGYTLNSSGNFYEKTIKVKNNNSYDNVTIKAVKLYNNDSTYNVYTCDTTENNKFIHIGFLTKGYNPDNLCMPCCFIKDQYTSSNKFKKDFFMRCLDDKKDILSYLNIDLTKIYILYDTIKLQENKFIHLDYQLDVLLNKTENNSYVLKNNYLKYCKTGYYFKYTAFHQNYNFLVAICSIYKISIENLIDNIIKYIENDTDNKCFNYLNNGDISYIFNNREKYIDFIQTSNILNYQSVGELICMPGLISKNGILMFILIQSKDTSKTATDKFNYYIDCLNTENVSLLFNDTKRDVIVLVYDNKYYHPIYKIYKYHKNISATGIFSYDDNIFKILKEYYSVNCNSNIIKKMFSQYYLIAKIIIELLNKHNIDIITQYIDDRNKCKYLLCNNKLLLPVNSSGISYKYSCTHINNLYNSVLPLKKTIELLHNIESILKLDYTPYVVYYNNAFNNKIIVSSILLNNQMYIPVVEEEYDKKTIKSMGLSISYQSFVETINKYIQEYNPLISTYDNQMKEINENMYISETYNLFKLELSYYLSINLDIKNKIKEIIYNKNKSKYDKKEDLIQIINNVLASKDIEIVKSLPDLKDYTINNIRDICNINVTNEDCNKNIHCKWIDNKCKFIIPKNNILNYLDILIEELIQGGIKCKEILQEDDYYVSDIVNTMSYTYRTNQTILKYNNLNINKILDDIFGAKFIGIGSKHIGKSKKSIPTYPSIIVIGNKYIQEIIPNNNSVLRSYSNSYYWILNPLYDINCRNLGYFNEFQSIITNILKVNIINFIQKALINIGDKDVIDYIHKNFYNENLFNSYLLKFRKNIYNTTGITELYILSHLINIPIVVYDDNYNIKYIFMQGFIEVNSNNIKKFTKTENRQNTIFLQFSCEKDNQIPNKIYSIYYI